MKTFPKQNFTLARASLLHMTTEYWPLHQVSVNDGKETYDFPCNRWLSEDEGDGKIQVELWAGQAADEPTGQGKCLLAMSPPLSLLGDQIST